MGTRVRTLQGSILSVVVLLVLAGPLGCDGCQSEQSTVPETAQGRAALLAEQFPVTSDGIVMVEDWERFRTAAEDIERRLNDVVPMADMPFRFTREYLDVDLQSPKSWKTAGIDPDGGGAVGWMSGRPVIAVFAPDAPAFETHLTENIASRWAASGDGVPSVRSRTVDGEQVKFVKLEDGELAWRWKGKLALVALPSPASKDLETRSSDVVAMFGAVESSKSLAEDSGYTDFRDALEKPPISAFAPTKTVFSRLSKALPGPQAARLEAIEKNATGFGLTFELVDDGVRTRSWIGLATESQISIAEGNWRDLATDQTLLGLRLSGNPAAIWSAFQDSDDPLATRIRSSVEHWSNRLNVDFKPGVVEPMAGHLGLFFYGIAPNLGLREFNRAPFQGIQKVGLIAAAKLDDPERFGETASTVAEAIEGMDMRPVDAKEADEPADVQVVTAEAVDGSAGAPIPGLVDGIVPLKLYLHDDTAALATTAFSESTMVEYLKGTREESGSLADSGSLDLGATFATRDTLNGIYLNMVRTRSHLGDRLPSLPPLQRAIDGIQEILYSDTRVENGVFMDLTVHLTEPPSN